MMIIRPMQIAKEFDSDYLEKGQKFSHRFDKAGNFDYFCLPYDKSLALRLSIMIYKLPTTTAKTYTQKML
jgi:hypothetical protein